MGLWASHGCWTGAYSAFTRWRNTIAVVAGYQLMECTPEEQAQGHYGDYPMIEWSGTTQRFIDGLRDAEALDEDVVFS